MAGTDITNLLEIIQRKIDAADSTSATQDLLYLLSSVRQGDGSSLELYDSTGAFPDLTDSDADTEMIGYKLDSDRLYFNVGVWKGKTLPPPPPPTGTQAQGTNYGYFSGTPTNVIEKFSFTSDGNSSNIGSLSVARNGPAGQSSTENGYSTGGDAPAAPAPGYNIIDKFPFATDTNASDVGDLTLGRRYPRGNSSSTSGYSSGGRDQSTSTVVNVTDKFPFSSDTNASDTGDLTVARSGTTTQSSTDNGYVSGGNPHPSPWGNIIDKFPFASDTNSTDVGDLLGTNNQGFGQNSETDGYVSGGQAPASATTDTIQKFPFSSDANSTDVANLTVGRYNGAYQSSSTSGYSSGGNSNPPFVNRDIIDKFSFSAGTDATDVGDLTATRAAGAGQQY